MLQYMLDTNIVIYTMNHRPAAVRKAFEKHYCHIGISSVTLMELYYGAHNSKEPQNNLAIIDGFIARLEVLPYGNKAASHSGQIKATQKRSGQPIGPYDQMIAGHARAEGLILVTNNTKEFIRVDGLMLENWLD